MSYITFSVIEDSTFEDISRSFYGTTSKAGQLKSANPGLLEPLLPGEILKIPQESKLISKRPLSGARTDDVMIFLNGKLFTGWNRLTITESLDNMATAAFRAPFDPFSKDQREAFEPFTYKEVLIAAGSSVMFTGTLIEATPSSNANKSEVTIKAYATPGVLNDCCPPPDFESLQFDGLNLNQIALTLAAPYGVGVVSKVIPDNPFESVAIEPDEKILSFLIKLAKERNVLLGSNSDGELVLYNELPGGPLSASLVDGESPLLDVIPSFRGQQYRTSMTVLSATLYGDEGEAYTVNNELTRSAFRPDVFQLGDSENAESKTAAVGRLGKMFADTIQYKIRVATWRNPKGARWRPNDFIQLLAPYAMVYSPYTFMVKDVSFDQDDKKQTALLTLIFPGVMSGAKIPTKLPWFNPGPETDNFIETLIPEPGASVA